MNPEDPLLDASTPPTLIEGRLIAWSKVGASIRNADPRTLFKGRLYAHALTLSPLVLAAIVVGGLGILCLENLVGAARHMNYDHSEAIRKLLFRS